MKKSSIFLGTCLLALAFLTACNNDSDSIEGNSDLLKEGLLTLTNDDGTKMFFLDQGDGTVAVTYDRSNPRHLTSDFKATLTDYVGNVNVPEQVTIGGTTYRVTAVTNGAFCNNTTLTSVTLPESVTTIGNGAFTRCTSMTTVNIPSAVKMIPEACFGSCSKLANITLPDGLTEIGANAFYGCAKLTTLTLPESLTCIGQNAFTSCKALKELTLPAAVEQIGDHPLLTASKLTKLHVKRSTPVELTDSLTDVTTMVLYVPTGSKEAYESATFWNKLTIVEE